MLTFMRGPVQALTGKVNWRNHQEPINTIKNTNTGPRTVSIQDELCKLCRYWKETTFLCTTLGHCGLQLWKQCFPHLPKKLYTETETARAYTKGHTEYFQNMNKFKLLITWKEIPVSERYLIHSIKISTFFFFKEMWPSIKEELMTSEMSPGWEKPSPILQPPHLS